MNLRNNVLPVISLPALVILVLVTLYFNGKESAERTRVLTGLSKQPPNDSFRVRPLTNVNYEVTAKRLSQGQYLAEGILQCFTCHSPRQWEEPGAPPLADQKGSGGTIVQEDSTSRIIAPNITPDAETGAGRWTDDMLARAIREGVGHDGRALSWQMPYLSFRDLSDEDLASVIVYLRSLPPVHHVVPPTKIPAEVRSWTEKSLQPLTRPVLMPDFSDPIKRGRYLVGLGECVGCHTAGTAYNPGLFAGGNLGHRFGLSAFSSNLTPHPSGISYAEGPEGFIYAIRTGKGGTLSPIMPWVAFRNLTDADLKAMYAYLRSFPASPHYISNQAPFTQCAVCGQRHGLGDRNNLDQPAGIKLNAALYNQYAGTYWNEAFNQTLIIFREGNQLMGQAGENAPRIKLIPQSHGRFLAPGWYLPIRFVKDNNGQVTQLVEESDLGQHYKKIK